MTAATLLLAILLVRQRNAVQIAAKQDTSTIVATQIVAPPREAAARSAPRPEISTTGWLSIRPPKSGYLGVRYVALTQGVAALDSRSPAAGGDRDSSSDLQRTQRELLNELLPTSLRETNPRS